MSTHTTRQQMWDRLEGTFDVLIVGGGINGAGIARDAAKRGLSVAMVEMNDLASGTSSNSSKLVHGGIRYLEQLEFSLVFESVSERRILMDIAPHIVNPLGFLFPVYKGTRRALTTINAGMWLYEGLSLFRSPKRHRSLNVQEIEKEEPALKRAQLKGAPLYYDCSTDDARLTLENAVDAALNGAVIATYAKLVSFDHASNSGRATGATIEDSRTGERKHIRANAIINATGPWTDALLATSNSERGHGELLRPTKGVHAVVDHKKLPVNNAVVCFHPDDGRVLFAIPWEERTYLGTTDTDYKGDPSKVAADSDDIDYILKASNFYFPDHPLVRTDVISTWAGLRPLIRPVGRGEVDESAVSREHQIIVGQQDGIITIAGGKLTTYRKMSQEVVDMAVKLLRLSSTLPSHPMYDARTAEDPLPGAVDWPADDDHERVAQAVLACAPELMSIQTARHLANTYGMRALEIAQSVAQRPELGRAIIPGRNEILAQVEWAVTREFAATVTDVMVRRTQLYYRAFDQGLEAAKLVADHMAQMLKWTSGERARHLEEYGQAVARTRQWRQPGEFDD